MSDPTPDTDPQTGAPLRMNAGPAGNIDLPHLFTYHAPDADAIRRHGFIRDAGLRMAQEVAQWVPPGPERSTAVSRIREAVMWANAGIACNDPAPAPGAETVQ